MDILRVKDSPMKNKLITTLLLLSSFIFVSCSEDIPQFTALPNNATILAFGDSLTAGKGVNLNSSYPAILQQLSHTKVINAGISGEVSANGLKRLPALLKKHQHDLVIICHGGNDILRHYNLSRTKLNIIKMIELVKSYNAQILLVAVPKPTLLLSPAKFYFDIAEMTNTTLNSDTLPSVLKNSKLKSDAYHPNESGYTLIAQQIFAQLSDLGAFK